jgi:hypothetical protein
MGNTLATMLTMTTYGTWLRGDRRGYVEDGKTFPPDPELESADRSRMKHPVYLFPRDRLLDIGTFIGESLVSRLDLEICALHVGTWHAHLVIGPTQHSIAGVVKCAKDAVRYGLRPGRPIWTDGYDKRFCFDERTKLTRIRYVERHNESHGWPAKPWPFITPSPTAHTPNKPHLTPNHLFSPRSI